MTFLYSFIFYKKTAVLETKEVENLITQVMTNIKNVSANVLMHY